MQKIEARAFKSVEGGEKAFWITPVKPIGPQSAETIIQKLAGQQNVYAFGWHGHGRKLLRAQDSICFYVAQHGVIGHAKVKSPPIRTRHDWIPYSERYPWVFELEDVRLYLDEPTRLDLGTRMKLDAFKGRLDEKNFGWFVRSTHRISKNDFHVLTKHAI